MRASLANVKLDDYSMDIFLLNISDIKGEPEILEHQIEILWMDLDEILERTDLTQSTWVLAHRLLMDSQDIIYPGMGTLANGGMGSPTQFMLDMEIRKSQFAMQQIGVSDPLRSVDLGLIVHAAQLGPAFLGQGHAAAVEL